MWHANKHTIHTSRPPHTHKVNQVLEVNSQDKDCQRYEAVQTWTAQCTALRTAITSKLAA